MKPTLIYLFDEPPTEAVKIWPEFSDVHMIDIKEQWESEMPLISGRRLSAISIPEGSEKALHIVSHEVYDSHHVVCITVRPEPGAWPDWWTRLGQNIASMRGISVAWHTRHEVCEVMGLREYKIAVMALDRCAELLRSEGVDTSPEAMRTEKALSKAIETLRSTGFRAPRNR